MLQVIRVTQALMMTELETLLGPAGARPSGLTRRRLGLFILFALTPSLIMPRPWRPGQSPMARAREYTESDVAKKRLPRFGT